MTPSSTSAGDSSSSSSALSDGLEIDGGPLVRVDSSGALVGDAGDIFCGTNNGCIAWNDKAQLWEESAGPVVLGQEDYIGFGKLLNILMMPADLQLDALFRTGQVTARIIHLEPPLQGSLSYQFWSKQSTPDIIKSLAPGVRVTAYVEGGWRDSARQHPYDGSHGTRSRCEQPSL